MADSDHPQIYLVTPPEFDLSRFPSLLKSVLDQHDIACLRLALVSSDEDRVARAADALREVAHEFDVPLVIDSHIALVERLGLDGVHLVDGARSVRSARKALGSDAIVGAFCGTSRHEGMNAGEAGSDYVSFGPVTASALGDGSVAEFELFEWWSQMIEIPVVAEGQMTDEAVSRLWQVAEFLAIGEEIWRSDDPAAALTSVMAERV